MSATGRMRSLRAATASLALVAASVAGSFFSAMPTAHAQSDCVLNGSPREYVVTLDDFGRKSSSLASEDEAYWGGKGYLARFRRDEWSNAVVNPWGAYLAGASIRSNDARTAAAVLQDAVDGWTSNGEWYRRDVRPLGDEIVVMQRMTTWEALQDSPMVEVFVAMRRCNVTAHVLFAVMPELDPIAQAMRYAEIIDRKLGGS
jgi:hypothetical protein